MPLWPALNLFWLSTHPNRRPAYRIEILHIRVEEWTSSTRLGLSMDCCFKVCKRERWLAIQSITSTIAMCNDALHLFLGFQVLILISGTCCCRVQTASTSLRWGAVGSVAIHLFVLQSRYASLATRRLSWNVFPAGYANWSILHCLSLAS